MSRPIRFIDAPVFKHDLMTVGEDGAFYRTDLQPGDARWNDFEVGTQLAYSCPCGCGSVNTIPVHSKSEGYGWTWNGNREKPTLNPSIQQTTKCRWHGHLIDGVFVP